MSLRAIQTDVVPFYDEVVNLGGTDYLLSFAYNQRVDAYYLTISTPDGTQLVGGIKIVANWPLLHKYAFDGLPAGEITAVANTQVSDPAPGLGQIGANLPFTLFYIDEDSLP